MIGRLLAAGALVAVLGTGVLATRIQTPARAAATADPPEPAVLTAPVEVRTLAETVTLRGTVAATDATSVGPPSIGGAIAVVTTAPPPLGGVVQLGQVVLEVAGRPVLALEGDLPAYRDLRVGLHGPDVAQLQSALRRLGYRTPTDGQLGQETAAAIDLLLRDRGIATAGPEVGAAPGTLLPRGEVVFVPHLPALVVDRRVERGDVAPDDGPALVLASGRPHLTADLTTAQAALVAVGDAFSAIDDSTGAEQTGRVVAMTAAPASAEGRDTHPIEGEFDGTMSPSMLGANLRVRIRSRATGGAVLAVPVSALNSDDDGRAIVEVVRPKMGTRTVIRVDIGRAAGGYVELVHPPARLRPGVLVLVGGT